MSATPAPWISAAEAARILGIPRARIERLVSAGLLVKRDLPGIRLRYSRAEVEALARSCVRRTATADH